MSSLERYYRVLGLESSASREEVKQAYRRLCVQHHPDLAKGADKSASEQRFKEITDAYSRLYKGGRHHRPYPTHSAYSSHSSGHEYSQWARRGSRGFSNAAVAGLLSIPLLIGGIRLGVWYSKVQETTGRQNGLMNPPVNEFLGAVPRGPTEAALQRTKARKDGSGGPGEAAGGARGH